MKIPAVKKETPGATAEQFKSHLQAEANNVRHTLPLVKEGLIMFDLIPLTPYPGFARLFEEI